MYWPPTAQSVCPLQQRTDDVDKALGTLFLNGISTHKLKAIAEQLNGRSVSAQTVSTIVQKTDEALEQYRTKPIEDKYEFVFLDGIYDKIREIGLERKVLLCALGMTKDGQKEILSVHLVDAESEANWTEFLIDLKNPGLNCLAEAVGCGRTRRRPLPCQRSSRMSCVPRLRTEVLEIDTDNKRVGA